MLLVPLVCGLAACGNSKEHASSGVGGTCIATVVRDGVTYYGDHVDRPAKTDGSAGTGVIPPCFDTMPATKGAAEQVGGSCACRESTRRPQWSWRAGRTLSTACCIVLIGIAGLVALVNVLIQLSLQSEDDRAEEERRRNERRF